MQISLSNDSAESLRKYVEGALPVTDLARWLAQASYDLDVPESERNLLASIDLIATEVIEQLRPEEDLRRVVGETLPPLSTKRSLSA